MMAEMAMTRGGPEAGSEEFFEALLPMIEELLDEYYELLRGDPINMCCHHMDVWTFREPVFMRDPFTGQMIQIGYATFSMCVNCGAFH